MAAELGKAYVQIIPSAKGISGAISSELGAETKSAGQTAGLNIAGAIKTAIAAAGIGTAIKSALEAGGNLQQSFGGLETLYGDAADAAKKYATEAAAAGISANDYAEQAVSFGAALKSAFEGDTIKAAEAANTAILDMADNAAKMGTPLENIQTAYQGFAKQNYTMLDNLKLGYGGTKSEMERLLADAQKISGVKYDISNLGDVYDAIHVIQTDLGLTGVAAAEASTTFTGSFGAMKAAAENLMANLALGENIGPALDTLGQTVNTFLFSNLLPMIGNIASALPDLISGLGSMAIGILNQVATNSDELVQTGIGIVTSLVEAIVSALPYLAEAAINIAVSLGEALLNTDWASVGSDLISSLKDSLDLASGEILGSDDNIITAIMDGITAGLPNLLTQGVEIITNIANGIIESIPQMVTTAGTLITQFTAFLMQNFPTILKAGADLILNLVDGIVNNLPQIVNAVVEVIASFIATVASNLPQILAQGITIIGKLAAGLIQAIPNVVGVIPQIIQAIVNAFGGYDWASIGRNILEGIKDGILNAVDTVVSAARSAGQAIWDSVKDFFKIESPSKLMFYAGEMIDAGLASGIQKNVGLVENAIDILSNRAMADLNLTATYSGGDQANTERDAQMEAVVTMLSNYLPVIAEKQGISVQQLYNGINRQLGWALQ